MAATNCPYSNDAALRSRGNTWQSFYQDGPWLSVPNASAAQACARKLTWVESSALVCLDNHRHTADASKALPLTPVGKLVHSDSGRGKPQAYMEVVRIALQASKP